MLYALAGANAFVSESFIPNLISASAVLGVLGAISLISKQKLGLGDVLILSALVLFRGFTSGVFIFNTALVLCLVLCIVRLTVSKKKKSTETAFVPFLSIGFVMSFI